MTGEMIRTAEPGDVPAIRDVAERTWDATYSDFLSQETIDAALDAWYDKGSIEESVAEDETTYLVAVDDGDVVGYVYGGPYEPDAASLAMLYVHSDRWGEGIGSALLAEFEEYCRDCGCDTVQLEVLAENDVGLSFYRKHGYEVVGEGESELFGETVRGCVVRGQLA